MEEQYGRKKYMITRTTYYLQQIKYNSELAALRNNCEILFV